MSRRRFVGVVAAFFLVSLFARAGVAQLLYSFEDGTTEGWTPTIIESGFDDMDSQLSVVSGPGNTHGQKSLKVVGRSGGFVRNVSVILDPDRIDELNNAVLDGWNIAFDWTIVASENPGAQAYLAQLSIGNSAGWTQLDMNSLNGFPVWDPTGPDVQTMSPSIPLSGFGSGELGYNGVPLDGSATLYFLNIALSSANETNDTRTYYLDNFRLVDPNAVVNAPGDFNGDKVLDAADIDALTAQAATFTNPAAYDLNADALVDEADIKVWVKDLFGSWIGDADLNREFTSSDLVVVLASGTYEAAVDSVWTTGDFNGDGRTNSGDLVAALADGGYELGPPPAAAVPEPSGLFLGATAALLAFVVGVRQRGSDLQFELVTCVLRGMIPFCSED